MSVIVPYRGFAVASTAKGKYRLQKQNDKEMVCPRCGKKEVLVPFEYGIVLCPNCFNRWHKRDELVASKRATPFLVRNTNIRCQECGGWNLTMWYVRPGRLCYKCVWHAIAHKSVPLKVDGVRW